MIGLILCGGQSRRMGQDKGMTALSDMPMALRVYNTLSDLMPAYISIRNDQIKDYKSLFESDILIPDSETFDVGGPLQGLLSAYLKYESEDILLCSCDMPLIDSAVLQNLIIIYQSTPFNKSVHFEINNFPEPMPAIYPATILSEVYNEICNINSNWSLSKIAKEFDPVKIQVTDAELFLFKNVNTKEDLNLIEIK